MLNLANLSPNVDPTTLVAVSSEEAVKLATAYWFVTTNWAVSASEVADALYKAGMLEGINDLKDDVKETNRLLKKLMKHNLLAAERINGEKALTWQSYHAVPESSEEAEAEQAFIDTFQIVSDARPAMKTGREAASGPRYTPEQMEAGREARLAGASWPKVAEAAGVKSDGYFSRVLRATFADLA